MSPSREYYEERLAEYLRAKTDEQLDEEIDIIKKYILEPDYWFTDYGHQMLSRLRGERERRKAEGLEQLNQPEPTTDRDV